MFTGYICLAGYCALYLLPPYAVKVIVDQLANGKLTVSSLRFWFLMSVLAGLMRYGLGYIWRVSLYGAAYRLGKLLRKVL
ncbi:MAG: hypothetical protein WB502_13455 [Thermoactinomyces sp.]